MRLFRRLVCWFRGHDYPDLFDMGPDPDLVAWRGYKEDKCRYCGKERKVHYG